MQDYDDRANEYLDNVLEFKTNGFNHTLDTEQKYYSLDLLQHIDEGHLLSRMSLAIASDADLPVNSVFLIGLAIFSAMSCRSYVVEYYDHKPLPIGLYVTVEQPSGVGKTRCLSAFVAPFLKTYKKLFSEKKKVIVDSQEHLIEKEIDALEAGLREFSKRYFISNTTPEGLETSLDSTGGFFGCISSEQALLATLIGDIYKNASVEKPKNNEVVLSGFDGGFYNGARSSRISYSGDCVGAIACFSQHGSVLSILNASNGTGLSERFLMAAEPHKLGTRIIKLVGDEHLHLEVEYSNQCEHLCSVLNEPVEFDSLMRLRLTDIGYQLIVNYQNKIENLLTDGGRYSSIGLRGSAAKINMQIMKIAANLHLLERQNRFDSNCHIISNKLVLVAIGIAGELMESNYQLSSTLGIIGDKAEFQSIINLFERDNRPKLERNIINAKIQSIPFKNFSGNKSTAVRNCLELMVEQRILKLIVSTEGKKLYCL